MWRCPHGILAENHFLYSHAYSLFEELLTMNLKRILVWGVILLPLADLLAKEPIEIHFFGSSTCGQCIEIKEDLLRPLQEEHPQSLSIKTYDIDTDEGLSRLLQMEESYKVPYSSAQSLFLPDTFLLGYDDIMAHGRALIVGAIENSSEAKKSDTGDSANLSRFLRERTAGWGFFVGTLVAGLADGVNPCAIATMIFLISFLATQKRKRSEILTIGLAYTATVYITYFAMGIGFKHVVEGFTRFRVVSQIIRWGAFSAAAVIAVGSFRDAVVFARTKRSQDIKLQLPKAVKLRIHKVISGNLSGTSLIIGSIVTGFLVTLLEAICTGQMYLPYIVAMTRQSELRVRGILFLAFYNFLFVAPLLVVMVLAYYGLKWNDLAKQTQKRMVLIKVVLGLVMTGLAVYLVAAG